MNWKRDNVTGFADTQLATIDFGGQGGGILLIHGMMGRATTWSTTASWLTQHGKVVGYDARGHGLSGAPEGPYDRQAHIEDAAAVINAYGLAPAVVIGHSMGALTAWQLAGKYPDLVKAVVIGDMAAVVPDVQAHWQKWLDEWPVPFDCIADIRAYFGGDCFGTYMIGAHPDRIHPAEGDYFIEVFAEQQDGYWPLAKKHNVLACRQHWNNRDHTPELKQVLCPTLVAAGEHSYFPAENSRKMAEVLPKGEFVLIPEAGHVLHYDNPGAWRAAVEHFIYKINGQPR
ncbi:alpha/beta fold hydrolase [Erwinia sp. CPCC 100877]|nr:alpha/beta fold hydrolase [Erwinia sp. CPCC 100877]